MALSVHPVLQILNPAVEFSIALQSEKEIMKLFFDPETVALIGASANPLRPGYFLFKNLEICFKDKFYPVNPNLEQIEGKVCFKSILEVPARIDCAIIFIPAQSIPKALSQCAEKGIKAVIIESAGFSEVGSEGEALSQKCLEIARNAGMRLWGPNCMGMLNVPKLKILSFMNTAMWQGRLIPGKVSLVVQSGMLSAGFLMHILSKTPFGLSKVCSIGNKMDVDETDLLEYFLDDPETGVIGMYLESLKKGRKFFELARSTEKPIVVLKGGRSAFGQEAAKSHTAALAQDDQILDSAFRQAKIIRVNEMTELMDVARCLAVAPIKIIPKARIAVLTFSGGAGVVAADEIFQRGMQIAKLKPETLSQIKTVFPEWMNPSNPVDLYPAMEKFGPIKSFSVSLSAVMADPGVDAVFVHLFAPPIDIPFFNFDAMAELIRKFEKPIIAWIIGHAETAAKMTQELEKRGIAVADEIGKAIRILSALTMRK